ncbi:hypothetical protein DV736_g2977, partial [Chaetothyriales sp. CBS 134916]
MGCGSSKEHGANNQPARQIVIGAPQEVSIHIPRNRLDNQGVPIPKTYEDIQRPVLERALTLMAQYIAERNANITAITVGGAVNTLLIRSRQATHDVDIFGSHLETPTRMLLDSAMQFAMQQTMELLGTDWFNTETQMWMSPQVHRDLTQMAIQQNVVVFRQPGLTLLAAPWHYAFLAKIQRVMTGGETARPYDLDDAVTYLHEIVNRNGGHPIDVNWFMQMAARYHHSVTERYLLTTVNSEYTRRFHRPAIFNGRR